MNETQASAQASGHAAAIALPAASVATAIQIDRRRPAWSASQPKKKPPTPVAPIAMPVSQASWSSLGWNADSISGRRKEKSMSE